MRAKNEFKFLAEAYDTKLILERVVDGKLMCPEACCGSPVMECKCGPDCPHCNCHEIQKLAGKDKTIKEFYKMRDPDGDGSWPDDEREEERRKNPDDGEPEYQDTDGEYGEDEERITDVFYKYVDKIEQDIYNGMTFKESMISNKIDPSHWNNLLDIYTEYMEDKTEGPFETGFEDEERVRLTLDSPGTASVHLPKGDPRIQKYLDHGYKIVKDYKKAEQDEEGNKNKEFAASLFAKSPADQARSKRAAERVLGKRRNPRPKHLFTKDEDNEEPKRGITGHQHTDALAQAAFAKKDKVDIDKIDLNKWREYPAEDVMKAVYRRYGKELPSVDSYDWAISWDKKIRPWLKEHEGTF